VLNIASTSLPMGGDDVPWHSLFASPLFPVAGAGSRCPLFFSDRRLVPEDHQRRKASDRESERFQDTRHRQDQRLIRSRSRRKSPRRVAKYSPGRTTGFLPLSMRPANRLPSSEKTVTWPWFWSRNASRWTRPGPRNIDCTTARSASVGSLAPEALHWIGRDEIEGFV
jgi:hypothetical protein